MRTLQGMNTGRCGAARLWPACGLTIYRDALPWIRTRPALTLAWARVRFADFTVGER